jgi:hypothetical protein
VLEVRLIFGVMEEPSNDLLRVDRERRPRRGDDMFERSEPDVSLYGFRSGNRDGAVEKGEFEEGMTI